MPSGISDYGVTAFLQSLLNISAITDVWVAACIDEPGVAMDGTILADLEPVGGGYARQHLLLDGANWGLNGATAASLVDVTYPVATLDWGVINHYAYVSASSGGQLYAWGEFTQPQSVDAAGRLVIPAGGLIWTAGSQQSSITV